MGIVFGISIIIVFFLLSFLIYKAYREGKWRNCLYLILFMGIAIRLFLASDPYLHKWDERFHALVAKNLMDHPLKPTLYDNPILPYEISNWIGNHVWLTKPTFPLWCMAGSMKVFGVSEYSLRLPSLIVALLGVFLTYYIGKELFEEKTALIAAFLHAIHGLSSELSTGLVSSDHVETFLLISTQAGILFAILYTKYASTKYLVGIGICTGLAFFSKWISGFMVLFVFMGFLFHKKASLKELRFISLIVGTAFFFTTSPWIIYLLINHPQESDYIISQFLSPIREGVENHTGSIFYYLEELRILFGELIYLPLVWLAYKYVSKRRRSHLFVLFYWILIPLVLLSIADMKRFTYILVSAPAIFLLTALFIRWLQIVKNKINIPHILANITLVLLIALPMRYALERIAPFKERFVRPTWHQTLNDFSLRLDSDPTKTVLIGEPHHIEAMFYFEFVAYNYIPKNTQIETLKAEGYRVFENAHNEYVEK